MASRLTAHSGTEARIRLPIVGALLWGRLNRERIRRGLGTAVARGAEVPEELIDAFGRTQRTTFVGSTVAINSYLEERPLRERLDALDLPVTVIFGDADQRVDPTSLATYEGLDHVSVRRIAGVGQTPPRKRRSGWPT